MAYTLDFDISLGSSKTGLTLNAQIVDTAGVAVGAAITTGFTEIASGCYLLHCTTIPDGHRGALKIYTAGAPTVVWALGAINPQEGEYVATALAAITALNNLSADDVLDEVVEGTTTMRQLLRLYAAVLFNKASGGDTPTIIYRDMGDTKARVTLAVDVDGNRSAVTLDGT